MYDVQEDDPDMPRGRDRRAYRNTGARCAFCGAQAGNIEDVPVYRYRLQRSAYRDTPGAKSISVGAIGLCDPCIALIAEPPRDYTGRNTSRKHRHARLDGGRDEWHQHGGYAPQHRHPALGPELGIEAEPTPIRRRA